MDTLPSDLPDTSRVYVYVICVQLLMLFLILGNLSANCVEDQKFLRDNGAIPMLRSLICSKHKMISTGSTLALRNLLNYQKSGFNGQHMDSVSRSLDLKELPTLSARKQKALEQELDQNLANSCSSDEVTTPPKDFAQTTRNLMTRCFKNSSSPVAGTKELQSKQSNQSSFDSENENVDESPIDYSQKYSDVSLPGPSKNSNGFQETDLDQPTDYIPTDYSKRYAENVSDSEEDKSSPFDKRQVLEEEIPVTVAEEDQVKCFFTEGTPQVISNAASITDLRGANGKIVTAPPPKSEQNLAPTTSNTKNAKPVTKDKPTAYNSGIHSPERPVNYCVEGTPGGLSRCDSFGDLVGECDEIKSKPTTVSNTPPPEQMQKDKPAASSKLPVSVNFADETPLMFSRTSSLGSLGSQESVCNADDRSSVISEFR